MAEHAADWYPDPTGQFQLRYWDGDRWTDHVATAGLLYLSPLGAPAPGAGSTRAPLPAGQGERRGSLLAAVAGSLAMAVAVGIGVVGLMQFLATLSGGSELPDGRSVVLNLPTHDRYGIFIDADGYDGYVANCRVFDEGDGSEIPLMDSGGTFFTSSATEKLDLEFDTGTGRVQITCSVPGTSIRVAPVPDLRSLLVVDLVTMLLLGGGLTVLLVWGSAGSVEAVPR